MAEHAASLPLAHIIDAAKKRMIRLPGCGRWPLARKILCDLDYARTGK